MILIQLKFIFYTTLILHIITYNFKCFLLQLEFISYII